MSDKITDNTTSIADQQQKPSTTDRGETYTLKPESELRLEIPTTTSISITLLEGSAEIFGAELAQNRPHLLSGTKIAIFTWHGCKIHVVDDDSKGSDGDGSVDSSAYIYISEETDANVAYVNTHAQLEVMRDAALNAINSAENSSTAPPADGTKKENNVQGPRVLIAGPPDCGKTSLVRTLLTYATKLGRTPLLIDLDSSTNMLSVPGTIAASPVTSDSMSVKSSIHTSTSILSNTTPLVLWYGSTDISTNPDLYKSQISKLGSSIEQRLNNDADAKSSGFIVNTSGHRVDEDVGYKLLLHAAEALECNVVLVVGHDRLYSMMNTYFSKKESAAEEKGETYVKPKIIKLPRSGGVVSRDVTFRRMSRSLCIKRYFNGDVITPSSSSSSTTTTTTAAATTLEGTTTTDTTTTAGIPAVVHQYTPYLLEVPFSSLTIHKLTSLSLSASMLPVSAKQSTDSVQLLPIHDLSPTLKHSILAVCHPAFVEKYKTTGMASDLYLGGVAGFVAVEKVDVGRDVVSLLSPCSGALPSEYLLLGDITWME